jgi:hypothetical protein
MDPSAALKTVVAKSEILVSAANQTLVLLPAINFID